MATNINFVNDLNDESSSSVKYNLPRKIYLDSAKRSLADGANVEGESCTYDTMLSVDRIRLLNKASLLITPTSYKEGKLYSEIPTYSSDGDLSVTRATTARRINAAGLIEEVPYNLIPNSNNISLSWSRPNVTIVSSNNLAPDGTLTATRLSMPNGSSSQLFNAFPSVVGSYTTSIWVRLVSGTGNFKLGFFDNASILTDAITVTSTWQRFSVTKTLAASVGARGCWLYSDEINQVIEVFGGQVVDGTQTKDYLRTETRLNIPRLDYSNGTCPSLLVEPQRTNLTLYSEQLDNAYWTKVNATLSANSVVSPSGVQNADQVTFTSGGFVRFNQTPITPLTAYTISAWVKKPATGGANSIRITTNNTLAWNTGISQEYTLTTEWQRIVLSGNIISSGTGAYVIIGGVDATGATDTDAIGIVHIWGAQLELGAYATSYIPTTSASVTRNLDSISKTGISSLIGQTEGTMFVDVDIKTLIGNKTILSIQDSQYTSNAIRIEQTNNFFRFAIQNGGVTILNVVSLGLPLSVGRYKMALAYNTGANQVAYYLNGVQLYVGTTSAIPSSLVNFILGSRLFTTAYDNIASDNFNSAVLWKERLSNAELTALTTL
jgi:hypothetical protein